MRNSVLPAPADPFVATTNSDPTAETRSSSGGVPNHATTFLGDYSAIAASPGGRVVALWTDGRNTVCFTVRCGSGENAYFAGPVGAVAVKGLYGVPVLRRPGEPLATPSSANYPNGSWLAGVTSGRDSTWTHSP
jgi:hypothetical protein